MPDGMLPIRTPKSDGGEIRTSLTLRQDYAKVTLYKQFKIYEMRRQTARPIDRYVSDKISGKEDFQPGTFLVHKTVNYRLNIRHFLTDKCLGG